MQVSKGGQQFGFCPGKATWDDDSVTTFRLLVLSFEMKTLPYSGSIMDQPEWFPELMASFAPAYDSAKFASRARMILGSGKSGSKPGSQPTRRAHGKR